MKSMSVCSIPVGAMFVHDETVFRLLRVYGRSKRNPDVVGLEVQGPSTVQFGLVPVTQRFDVLKLPVVDVPVEDSVSVVEDPEQLSMSI